MYYFISRPSIILVVPSYDRKTKFQPSTKLSTNHKATQQLKDCYKLAKNLHKVRMSLHW